MWISYNSYILVPWRGTSDIQINERNSIKSESGIRLCIRHRCRHRCLVWVIQTAGNQCVGLAGNDFPLCVLHPHIDRIYSTSVHSHQVLLVMVCTFYPHDIWQWLAMAFLGNGLQSLISHLEIWYQWLQLVVLNPRSQAQGLQLLCWRLSLSVLVISHTPANQLISLHCTTFLWLHWRRRNPYSQIWTVSHIFKVQLPTVKSSCLLIL